MHYQAKHQNSFTELKASYSVNDLISKETKFLFILESPHKDEVKKRAPVAGSSGKMMSKFIFHGEVSDPLGIMVQSPFGYKQASMLEKIALLNVSPIPLQGSAYKNASRNSHKDFIAILEKIRINLSKQYRNPEWTYVRSLIRNDLIRRLTTVAEKNLIVIPCGKFAQQYYLYAKGRIGKHQWGEILDVPHPSRNQWYKDIHPLRQLILAIKSKMNESEMNH